MSLNRMDDDGDDDDEVWCEEVMPKKMVVNHLKSLHSNVMIYTPIRKNVSCGYGKLVPFTF